jgi:chromosomal replication initiation ATPase DnaA
MSTTRPSAPAGYWLIPTKTELDLGPPSVDRILDNLRARDLLTLIEQVGARRGVSVQQLCGRERSRSICWARQEVWWKLRYHPERFYSLLEIARLFGRNHTTVSAGIQAHRRRLETATAGGEGGKAL